MPQFSPGESKVAIATFPVSPAGLICTAELWLGSNSIKAATSGEVPFVSTGVDQSITLPITMPGIEGTYPVNLHIFSNGVLIAAFRATEDAVITPKGLVLRFANPKYGATFWDARVFDLALGQWITSTPGGIREVKEDIAKTFPLTGTTFLLEVNEWSIGFQTWLGPYLVTIPQLGEYTWNSREGSIDGISCIELPTTNNRSHITGTVEALHWMAAGWAVDITITSVRGVEGYENVAQYFIGQRINIEKATVPVGPTGTILIKKGREITCYLEAGYLTTPQGAPKRLEWRGWDFHYPLEYPPEYYNLWGSLTKVREFIEVVGRDRFLRTEIDYTVSGVAPQCRIVAAEFGHWGIQPFGFSAIGPGSGTFIASGDVGKGGAGGTWIQMYAHPNVDAVWNPWSWDLENWQLVARLG